MGMPKRSRTKPDANETAFAIVAQATATESAAARATISAFMSEMGRRGGQKGGKARAANMTPEQRSEAARAAVNVRWAAKKKPA